jgi:deoxycytidylate deaminase
MLEHAANELVFAVVGHVGSGTSTVAEALQGLLQAPGRAGGSYDAEILKARTVIQSWAQSTAHELPQTETRQLEAVEGFQNLGDEMRKTSGDFAAVAKGLIGEIRRIRAEKTGIADPGEAPVRPDGKKRAYILDSIRHPAEVDLLRHIYQDAFVLIGVVCEEERRLSRVMKKYENAGEAKAKRFMQRDARALERYGQRVSDAFHLSDFFLDNTVERLEKSGAENPNWDINDKLSRLIKIMTHAEIMRPEISETAMHHAHAAAMRSACLSRQVGAALMDAAGNVVATGTNEVPQAGGGVYGQRFDEDGEDHRCAFRRTGSTAYCSNTRQQNELVKRLIEEIPELNTLDNIRKNGLQQEIRQGGVGDLLEFSRAVHAEMDAVLSAGRSGISTLGTRLVVTTFPCHYCARHIVCAGIDEVQFIEPYPKSQALGLHADAIQLETTDWKPPSEGGTKVLFRPFVGVAPRLYRRAFLKDRDLKNPSTGEIQIDAPEWGTPWHLRVAGYVELEAALFKAE